MNIKTNQPLHLMPNGAELTASRFAEMYAALAPKVSEAWAFLKSGNTKEALDALDRAQELVNSNVSMYVIHFPIGPSSKSKDSE